MGNLLKNTGCQGKTTQYITRADPSFFVGGGALVSCSTFNTNKPKSFFFAEYQLYQKTADHLRRGGGVRTPCTLPLDPPLHNLRNNNDNNPQKLISRLTRHVTKDRILGFFPGLYEHDPQLLSKERKGKKNQKNFQHVTLQFSASELNNIHNKLKSQ